MIRKYFKKYEEDLKNSLNDLKHKDTFYKQIPNLLTFTRLVCAIPAGLIYYFNPTISIISIALLWGTDAIDGKIARNLNIQSKLGADMDTVADKIMFLASSLPLLINAPILGINFLLEAAISTINLTGRIKGLNTKTVLSGKIKTVSMAFTLVFGYLTQFFGVPSLIFKTLIGLTTILQCVAVKDYITEFIKMNNELKNNDSNKKRENINEISSENEKTLTSTKEINRIKQLNELRSFVLTSQLPSRVYTGKKRIRKMIQNKKNN